MYNGGFGISQVQYIHKVPGVQLCVTKATRLENRLWPYFRLDQEEPDICWIYPLRGIPIEMPVKNSDEGAIQCEAGCQLETKREVLLSGLELGSPDQQSMW